MVAMDEPAIYIICVRGQLDSSWAEWFGGLTVTPCAGGREMVLSGRVSDQAALHGILTKLHNLNLILLSVSRREAEPANAPAATPLP